MPTLYKLPKINADMALHLDTPVAGDTVLANGVLTVKDEAGDVALVVKMSDITSYSYAAAAAGTANVVNVVLTSTPLAAGASYSITISAPYVQNFFGGGQETGAIYQARTYTVSFAPAPVAAPTVDDIVMRCLSTSIQHCLLQLLTADSSSDTVSLFVTMQLLVMKLLSHQFALRILIQLILLQSRCLRISLVVLLPL